MEMSLYCPAMFTCFSETARQRGSAPHPLGEDSLWRQRLSDKLELLLAESLRVAHEAGALRTKDLKRVTVDTTVQAKAISFPTNAKLLHAAIRGLRGLPASTGSSCASLTSAWPSGRR